MKYTWTCSLHGVSGRGDDNSLPYHEEAEHGGQLITVMMTWDAEDEDDSTTV